MKTAVFLLILWMLIIARTQSALIVAVRYQSHVLIGHEADLMNLQRQLNHTYVPGPPSKHVGAETPRPLRVIQKAGQRASDKI